MIGAVILQIFLIFLNSIFSSAEIAIVSLTEADIHKLEEDGDRRAKKLERITKQPTRFLVTIQAAVTIISFLGSALAADAFAGPLVKALKNSGLSLSERILHPLAVILITLVLAYFTMVFGKMIPQKRAVKKADSTALHMSGLLYLTSVILTPLVSLLTISSNLVLRLFGIDPYENEEQVTEEEIRMMLVEGTEQGTIPEEEHELIQHVFDFNDITVEKICTHRPDIVWLSLDDDSTVWEKTIKESRHTHYLICQENLDNVVAVLDTRDYFRAPQRTRKYIMENLADKASFVPESMKANTMFRQMKESRQYFNVIVNEYGGVCGIITLHDIMEALVGDLDDQEEAAKPEDIVKVAEREWKIQGSASLEEVEEELQVELPHDGSETFNGFICGLTGRIPRDGESFRCSCGPLHIHVLDVKHHMVVEGIVTKEAEKAVEEEK